MAPSWDLSAQALLFPEARCLCFSRSARGLSGCAAPETCCGQQHAFETEWALGMAQTLAAHPPSALSAARLPPAGAGREHRPGEQQANRHSRQEE